MTNPPPRRGALFVLLALVILGVCGWWIATKLREASAIQDCVMAGRRNCAPINN